MTTEGQMLTTEEWLDEFMMLGQSDQVAMVERMFKSAETAQRCFMQNHKGAMQYIRTHHCANQPTGRRQRKLQRHYIAR